MHMQFLLEWEFDYSLRVIVSICTIDNNRPVLSGGGYYVKCNTHAASIESEKRLSGKTLSV